MLKTIISWYLRVFKTIIFWYLCVFSVFLKWNINFWRQEEISMNCFVCLLRQSICLSESPSYMTVSSHCTYWNGESFEISWGKMLRKFEKRKRVEARTTPCFFMKKSWDNQQMVLQRRVLAHSLTVYFKFSCLKKILWTANKVYVI